MHMKICGMRCERDVHIAVESGADALGFLGWTHSFVRGPVGC